MSADQLRDVELVAAARARARHPADPRTVGDTDPAILLRRRLLDIAARELVDCPKCGREAGQRCRGNSPLHAARQKALRTLRAVSAAVVLELGLKARR